MFKRIFIFSALLLLTALFGCNRKGGEFLALLKKRGALTVAMDIDMPGYFILNGESYGYQYDMLKAYADHLGVNLVLMPEKCPTDCSQLLRSGTVDMVATLTSRVGSRYVDAAVPVYNTSYVILARKAIAKEFDRFDPSPLPKAMFGRQLAVSGGFCESGSFAPLLNSLRGASIFLASGNSFDLIESLSRGKYDYLICEKSEAQLGCALVYNVTQVFEFAEPVSMSLVIGSAVPNLREDFLAWYDRYRNSKEYALLNDLYFKKGIVGQFIGRHPKRNTDGISIYDDLIRAVGEEEGYDWRMLSAIAWNESRFNAYIVSRRGACGLMQIMPIVARQFNVNEEEMMKPEVNVRLAAKLLNNIERRLKLPLNTPYIDRISLVLACYNSGIGHVTDARNLAAKHGGNPNSWADVSFYLKYKSEPDYAADEVVKSGHFGGSEETFAFVEKVMQTSRSYCDAVES